jgi:phage/plasmid-like protein (TIGR03299 family)
MAHELSVMADGRTSMAYVGETPWHGLGQSLTPNSPIDVWMQEAGFDYEIHGGEVSTATPSGQNIVMPSRKLLYRSDTCEPLSIVSDKYKVVQPAEVMEFFRDLTEEHGWQLETAGILFGGAKYWALAKTGNETRIMGQDAVGDYMMLATACDGTMRTLAKRTSVRVVCNNTLSIAQHGEGFRVSHSSVFDPMKVKQELQLIDGWKEFENNALMLAERKVTNMEAIDYVVKIFGDATKPVDQQSSINTIAKVLKLYDGQGKGSELKAAKGTAWGLVNSVTEYVDWHKGDSQSRRLDAAWFGKASDLKERAFVEALKLAA